MTPPDQPPLALTLGDPAGVGPEIILKAWSALRDSGPAFMVIGDAVSLPNPSGLHARPAAVLAAEAKKFKSDIRLLRGADEANAKSVVALMGLATKLGDAIRVIDPSPLRHASPTTW